MDMHLLGVVLATAVLSSCLQCALAVSSSTTAADQQRPIMTGSMDCGALYMPCGLSIPKDISCPEGPGWCQKGSYCGADKLSLESRCLPVPADCGQPGRSCCPSNADSPHTGEKDVFRPAFCKGGAVCFSWSQLGVVKDFYRGNTGAYPCTAVPADCGSAAGKSCCPTLYKLSANPKIDQQGCWGPGAGKGLYCNMDSAALKGGAQLPFIPGTCAANDAECGTFGRACCVETTTSGNMLRCGSAGSRGYCAPAPTGQAGKQVCTQCPAADVVQADRLKYFGCD